MKIGNNEEDKNNLMLNGFGSKSGIQILNNHIANQNSKTNNGFQDYSLQNNVSQGQDVTNQNSITNNSLDSISGGQFGGLNSSSQFSFAPSIQRLNSIGLNNDDESKKKKEFDVSSNTKQASIGGNFTGLGSSLYDSSSGSMF